MQDLSDALTTTSSASQVQDETEVRVPPPPATPLDFPCCKSEAQSTSQINSTENLVRSFSRILRSGPSVAHLELLNVNLINNVPIDQLVPQSFLPPLSWIQDATKNNTASEISPLKPLAETLSNGGPVPDREVFYARVKELLIDNEDAFRAIQRRPPRPDHPPARVLHLRKFWQGLSFMADYWDTSLDNYSKMANDEASSAIDLDVLRSEAKKAEKRTGAEGSEDQTEETYTGRRTDTGSNMPSVYREDTISSFVEAVAWCFHCRLDHAHMQPKLKMQSMILPLPHTINIYRTPRDIRKARRGILEGPLAGVFCREQTSFRRPEDAQGEGKQEIMDLLREMGLMLTLSQKRAREGKEEELPGKDQWWATKPRWGGGPGGETGVHETDEIEEPTSADAPRKRTKKTSRSELWRNLKPPPSTWEKGITYLQIGKDENSEYDDVNDWLHHTC